MQRDVETAGNTQLGNTGEVNIVLRARNAHIGRMQLQGRGAGVSIAHLSAEKGVHRHRHLCTEHIYQHITHQSGGPTIGLLSSPVFKTTVVQRHLRRDHRHGCEYCQRE